MVPTEFWDAESDLSTQTTLYSVEQAKRFNERKAAEAEVMDFLSILSGDYGATETVVAYAIDAINGDVAFVRKAIDEMYRMGLKHNPNKWAVQLHYRYELIALNTLTSS